MTASRLSVKVISVLRVSSDESSEGSTVLFIRHF